MLRRYETLILARSESTAEDRAFLEKSITAMVGQYRGVFNSFDQWGKYRLAYPVQKENYGLYILVRYEISADQVKAFMKELEMFFKVRTGNFVLRHATVALEEDAPTTYARPEPVDSSKALAEAGAFLKENRMRDRGGMRSGKRFSHDHNTDTVSEESEEFEA